MNHSSAGARFHYVVRALLLAALAIYVMHLNESNLLEYYLAPQMQTLLLLCPVPLLFIAFGMVYHAVMGDAGDVCDCEHPHPRGVVRNLTVYGLFALPLLFGLLVPDQPLASSMAAKKGMVYTYPNPDVRTGSENVPGDSDAAGSARAPNPTGNESSPVDPFAPRDKYSVEFAELAKRLYAMPSVTVRPEIFSETVGAIEMYKPVFAGKPISVQGFVFRDDSMDKNMFAVSRFLLMCCTADAVPFGILVSGEQASRFVNDAWVSIEGTVQTVKIGGEERLLIQAESIEAIEEPASPYIFTNPDSVAAFDELYPAAQP
ncbi:TIGR03943 family protein [Paenibacillus lactis]|uniref:TIGR03943 family putative permease subunit n=1 Tax=Paenibacillus lactis TaxID=228574 RepID=UPI00203D3745|nr:TIGR03943 family protein [Paenibacillus lactis]MCM3496837.1 TIGR03943 family protein [Paenibacillus lactis]